MTIFLTSKIEKPDKDLNIFFVSVDTMLQYNSTSMLPYAHHKYARVQPFIGVEGGEMEKPFRRRPLFVDHICDVMFKNSLGS